MPVHIVNKNVADETICLSSRRHFLHRVNLHNLILERARLVERINDLVLLNRQRMKVDVLEGIDLLVFYEATELCHWHPFLPLPLPLSNGPLPSPLPLPNPPPC